EKIKKLINIQNAEVVFLCGGTQTNLIVIGNVLKPFEGVVAADTGHINVHEAGAIEATGHKVLTLTNHNGKIDPKELKNYLSNFYNDPNHSHAVYPGMVFISHPTECGTLYTKTELKQIHDICGSYNIPLYLDGARLGYGLMSDNTDVTIADIAKYTDIFYIGGTKVGALIGEALIFTNKKIDHLTTRIKQHGGLLAKGRLIGIQFDTLFTDNLYFGISKHAIQMANLLKKGLVEKGFKLYIDSPTNQQFIIIEKDRYEQSKQHIKSCYWCEYDDNHVVIRLVTSWATKKEDVAGLLDII
ncbi:MAG: aminotransferase class V-fold PLP-dependent enzyme, partial [Clostridia bacterium]|nr:aminotransferase class V-fold PLP-dependent enzyme [Clostridia bacterium]